MPTVVKAFHSVCLNGEVYGMGLLPLSGQSQWTRQAKDVLRKILQVVLKNILL